MEVGKRNNKQTDIYMDINKQIYVSHYLRWLCSFKVTADTDVANTKPLSLWEIQG